jgi:hypothetical protein
MMAETLVACRHGFQATVFNGFQGCPVVFAL